VEGEEEAIATTDSVQENAKRILVLQAKRFRHIKFMGMLAMV